jgi:hypothetical protein
MREQIRLMRAGCPIPFELVSPPDNAVPGGRNPGGPEIEIGMETGLVIAGEARSVS